MDKALNLIGLMKKANRISVTEAQSREDIKSGKSKLVLIASDCSEISSRKIHNLANDYGIRCMDSGYTKYELASAAGSGLCSVLSVNDSGFAEAWLKLIIV